MSGGSGHDHQPPQQLLASENQPETSKRRRSQHSSGDQARGPMNQQQQQQQPDSDSTGGSQRNIKDDSRGQSPDNDDGDMSDSADLKRRRVQRACDLCRRRKIRCDGAHTSRKNKKCSHCAEGKTECTYVDAAKRRGPPLGYLETLEWKVAKLESLVKDLSPHVNLSKEIGPAISRDSFDLDSFKAYLASEGTPFVPPSVRSKGARAIMAGANTAASSAGPKGSRSLDTQDPHAQGKDDPRSFRERFFSAIGPAPLGYASPLSNTPFSRAGSQGPSTAVNGTGYPPPPRSGSDDKDTSSGQDKKQVDEELDKDLKLQIETLQHFQGPNISEGYRYLGKSSGVQFLRSAMDYKAAIAGPSTNVTSEKRRLQYWALPIWEAKVSQSYSETVDLSRWPPEALAQTLIDAYFEKDNITMPLLNRKIFQQDYSAGRWKNDSLFAKVCLFLFAVAARHVDDPIVYWYADNPEASRAAMKDMEMYRHSAGWRWLDMAMKIGRSFLKPASLEDLQSFVLCAIFLLRSVVISTVWAVAGLGLKSAIDIGVHTRVGLRRCTSQSEEELYKRAFWCLVELDRMSCAAMGRTLSLRDEDFDVEYPLDVDDEYWDTGNPSKNFIQPAGQTSKVSMFIMSLKLERILAFALKNIYTVNRTARGVEKDDPEYQKRLIAELDSDLYAWLDQVPPDLKWDPERQDPVLFKQSAALFATYYFAQILIHRPFIPTSRTAPSVASLALPSLAICTNAARACARVVKIACERDLLQYQLCMPAFSSAIVLIMGLWAGNRTGGSTMDRDSNLEDVRACLRYLKMTETWWRGAGRMRDILMELANVSDASVDTPTPGGPRSRAPSTAVSPTPQESEQKRFHHQQQQQQQQRQSQGNERQATRMSNASNYTVDSLASSQPQPSQQPQQQQQQQQQQQRPQHSSSIYHNGPLRESPREMPAPEFGDPSLPWWAVSNSSGLKGLDGAISHPITMGPGEGVGPLQSSGGGLDVGPPDIMMQAPSSTGSTNLPYSMTIPGYPGIPPPPPPSASVTTQHEPGSLPFSHPAPASAHSLYPMSSHHDGQRASPSMLGHEATTTTTTTHTMPSRSVGDDFWAAIDPNRTQDMADMTGALADIWSMAPSTFEMDVWSSYLAQGQGPIALSPGAPQMYQTASMPQQQQQHPYYNA